MVLIKTVYQDKESGWPIFGFIPGSISHSVLNMNSAISFYFLGGFIKLTSIH